MKRKTIKRTCYTISALLVLAGLGDIGYNHADSYIARSYRPTISRKMITNDKRHHGKITFNSNHVHAVDTSEELQARRSTDRNVIGQIAVPSLGVHLPVFNGLDNQNLLLGVGTMTPNDDFDKGQVALAGHHMINGSALLSPVASHAHVGTDIYVTDDAHVWTYRISSRYNVPYTDTDVLNDNSLAHSSKPSLMLLTCKKSVGQGDRIICLAKQVKEQSFNKSSKLGKVFHSPVNDKDVLKGY